MNKNNIAKAILRVQKLALVSLGLGILITVIAIFVFGPSKFDDVTFIVHDGGQYGSTRIDMGDTPGFFDYTDGEVSIYPSDPNSAIASRKEYLYKKAMRIGFYGALGSFTLVLAIILIGTGQQWVNENAKE